MSPLRILVVSPDPDSVHLLEEAFTEWSETRWRHSCFPDFERVYALGASEARECLRRSQFDAALIEAGGAGGLNLAEWDRIRSAARDAPLVALVTTEDEGFRTMRLGGQDFLLPDEVDCLPLARVLRGAVERSRFGMARHAIMLTDEVTGLYNQRGFLEIAGRQGRLATEHGLPVSVWLVECAAGNGSEEDVTLAALHVAERLRGAAEDTDVLARWDERRFAALRLSDSPSWTERFGGGIPVQSIRVRIPADHPFELTSALAAAERALCQNKQERA